MGRTVLHLLHSDVLPLRHRSEPQTFFCGLRFQPQLDACRLSLRKLEQRIGQRNIQNLPKQSLMLWKYRNLADGFLFFCLPCVLTGLWHQQTVGWDEDQTLLIVSFIFAFTHCAYYMYRIWKHVHVKA